MITPVLPSYSRAPLSFVKGEGSWLFDEENKRYLDLGAGIAVTALGHAHPELVDTIQEQAKKLWHVSNLYEIPNQEELANRLVDETFADTVFFTNSGAESMECAIKMARKYEIFRISQGPWPFFARFGVFGVVNPGRESNQDALDHGGGKVDSGQSIARSGDVGGIAV